MNRKHRTRQQIPTNGRGKAFSRRDAAAYLGVTPGTLAVWASTGRYNLPYAKIGDKSVYFENDLIAFVESSMVHHVEELYACKNCT